jgi:hypothetical protein
MTASREAELAERLSKIQNLPAVAKHCRQKFDDDCDAITAFANWLENAIWSGTDCGAYLRNVDWLEVAREIVKKLDLSILFQLEN